MPESITLENIALQSTQWLKTFIRHGHLLMPYADEGFKALYRAAKKELNRRHRLDSAVQSSRKFNF